MSLNKTPIYGLIPARGGSKGVPKKNMRLIAAKPLIDYTILAAAQSSFIDKVFVSSDDEEILLHSKTLGVNVINRPAQFATDSASSVDVVNHFIGTFPDSLQNQDPYIVFLQPTSPLRTAHHIDDAIAHMVNEQAQYLSSVSKADKSPYKMFEIDTNGRLQALFKETLSNVPRQDLPDVFMPNGAIYIFRVSEFKARGGFPSNGGIPFIMSTKDSLDIDTEEDIEKAESFLGDN